jgi:hypothetical protein
MVRSGFFLPLIVIAGDLILQHANIWPGVNAPQSIYEFDCLRVHLYILNLFVDLVFQNFN